MKPFFYSEMLSFMSATSKSSAFYIHELCQHWTYKILRIILINIYTPTTPFMPHLYINICINIFINKLKMHNCNHTTYEYITHAQTYAHIHIFTHQHILFTFIWMYVCGFTRTYKCISIFISLHWRYGEGETGI